MKVVRRYKPHFQLKREEISRGLCMLCCCRVPSTGTCSSCGPSSAPCAWVCVPSSRRNVPPSPSRGAPCRSLPCRPTPGYVQCVLCVLSVSSRDMLSCFKTVGKKHVLKQSPSSDQNGPKRGLFSNDVSVKRIRRQAAA